MSKEGMAAFAAAGLLLAVCAIYDWKYYAVPVLFPMIGIIASSGYMISAVLRGNWGVMDVLSAALPGMLLLLTSAATSGKVGKGDGAVVLSTGFLLGPDINALLLTFALLSAMTVGIFLLAGRKMPGRTRIPFLPFCFFSYGGITVAKIVSAAVH